MYHAWVCPVNIVDKKYIERSFIIITDIEQKIMKFSKQKSLVFDDRVQFLIYYILTE